MGGTTVTGAWGYYGKIAAQGDFLKSALPRDFVSAWDAWLQAGLLSSRDALGEGWLERYLSAPIWRFAIAPGVAGRSAMLGVMMPSIDRVGRHFPLTVAAEAGAARPFSLLALGDKALAAVEQAALDTLDEGAGRDAFDAALAAAPGVPATRGLGGVRGQGADLIHARPTAAAAAIADRWCDERHGAASVWSAESPDGQMAGITLVARGLPDAATFATFLAPPAAAS